LADRRDLAQEPHLLGEALLSARKEPVVPAVERG
jgi:hypothetical protein